MIDLRSDTVTRPTPEMRRAMMEAEVGDDVYGEDPTVNRLEQRAAEIAGKEAALFVPTGTMGNTIAHQAAHRARPGSDLRFPRHVLDYELSMVAWFSGCVVRAIARPTTAFSLGRDPARDPPAEPALRAHRRWSPSRTRTTWRGGTVYPLARDPRDLRRRARARPARSTWMARASSMPPRALGHAGARNRGPGRHRDVLPLEGAGRAGGLDARRSRRH